MNFFHHFATHVKLIFCTNLVNIVEKHLTHLVDGHCRINRTGETLQKNVEQISTGKVCI